MKFPSLLLMLKVLNAAAHIGTAKMEITVPKYFLICQLM